MTLNWSINQNFFRFFTPSKTQLDERPQFLLTLYIENLNFSRDGIKVCVCSSVCDCTAINTLCHPPSNKENLHPREPVFIKQTRRSRWCSCISKSSGIFSIPIPALLYSPDKVDKSHVLSHNHNKIWCKGQLCCNSPVMNSKPRYITDSRDCRI